MRTRLAALAAAFLLPAAPAFAADDGLTIRTRLGVIAGAREGEVRTFRNIPYAAPPVGDLRWVPPQAPKPWRGVRPGDRFGPPCAQIDPARIGQMRRYSGKGIDIFFDPIIAPRSSEDCLTLNIWAPPTAKRAPVMVYFYGGGGSADMPFWNGSGFARSGVVFVTFNYRNLTLGKLAHPALTRAAGRNDPLSRYDVMDQLAMLRWVRDNIGAFGGDPGNVTIAGVSAGGAGVLQLLTVPRAKGLFHRAAVQSGNGWWAAANQTQNEQLGIWLAREAGLAADATVAQLRATPVARLPQIGHFAYDGRLMPMDPTRAFAAGRVIDVPLLIGWNSDDGSSLRRDPDEFLRETPAAVKRAYASDGRSGRELARVIYTDGHAGAPARWIARRTAAGAPTYVYYFSHVRAEDRGRSVGAAHGSELPYVMDNWRAVRPAQPVVAEEAAVTRTVHSCWVSFARSGRPRCDGAPDWPRYTAAGDRLMELGTTPTVRQAHRKAQLDAQEAHMEENLAAQRAEIDKVLAMAR